MESFTFQIPYPKRNQSITFQGTILCGNPYFHNKKNTLTCIFEDIGEQ